MTTASTHANPLAGALTPVEPVPPTDAAPVRPSALRLMVARPLTAACLTVVAAYVLAGLLGYCGFMQRAAEATVADSYAHPTLRHPALWFGADIQGRSVLVRTIVGTHVALQITVGAGLLSLTVGVALGVLSGYFGGWIDALVSWLFTTVSSVPWILLVIAITFAFENYEVAGGDTLKDKYGPLPAIVLALGLTDWVGICRLLRGEVFKHRGADYVAAARAAGAGTPRILVRHILPNVFHLVIITFTLGAVGYVQAEAALTFIGIGIKDQASWGRMIADAQQEVLRGVWWQIVAATGAIFVISLALNVVGDALRDALDPKTRGRS